jgi:membrane protein
MLNSNTKLNRYCRPIATWLRNYIYFARQRAAQLRAWKVMSLAVKNFLRNNDPLWASALTYTTTLSIVPILALALSTVSAFHATAGLHQWIQRYLAAGSPEIADRIISFVSNTDSRTLSAFGGIALLVTAIMTLGTVEQAFNNIFRAPQGRGWVRKVADYLAVVFALPPVVIAAVALREGITNYLPHWFALRWMISGLTLWGTLSFVYVFFPYTKVRVSSALVGGLAAAVLLDLAQRMFVHFQYGVSSYKAIYGALAAIPILMTWTYISWTILLYGGELAAALQDAGDLLPESEVSPADFVRAAALVTMLHVAERMVNRRALVDAQSIAQELRVTQAALAPVLRRLKDAGLIIEVCDGHGDSQRQGLFLARDPALISLAEVIQRARGPDEVCVCSQRVQNTIRSLVQSEAEILRPLTVRDLLDEAGSSAEPANEARWPALKQL